LQSFGVRGGVFSQGVCVFGIVLFEVLAVTYLLLRRLVLNFECFVKQLLESQHMGDENDVFGEHLFLHMFLDFQRYLTPQCGLSQFCLSRSVVEASQIAEGAEARSSFSFSDIWTDRSLSLIK